MRLSLVTLPADRTTERRVRMAAYERCKGNDLHMEQAMAEVVAEMAGASDVCVVCGCSTNIATRGDERLCHVRLPHCGGAECWARVHRAIDALSYPVARGTEPAAVKVDEAPASPDGEAWAWPDRGITR